MNAILFAMRTVSDLGSSVVEVVARIAQRRGH